MPEAANLVSPHLTLLPTRRSSPLCAFGTSIILIYICGIVIYLWSANYACRLRNLGETPPLILSSLKFDTEQRGKYIILKNYIRGALQINGNKGVTFTTAATFIDLSHVPEICSRWQGPMSISVYAPGSDFKKTLRKILHLRLVNSCIHQNVTWHLYFDAEYHPSPGNLRSAEEEAELYSPTSSYDTWIKGTFKSHGNLPFPANVGRNVAIQESHTDYVLMTDLLYYPSTNIIPRFLKLLEFEVSVKNKVFVLPVFKLDWYGKSPETKSELVQMAAEGNIILPSGTSDCTQCNIFPNARKWLEVRSSDDTLSVYYISRDKDEFESWQPYYISSRNIPLFDENQIKEGRYDRKLQVRFFPHHLYFCNNVLMYLKVLYCNIKIYNTLSYNLFFGLGTSFVYFKQSMLN